MRKFTLSMLFLLWVITGFSTTWVVTNSGFSFSPMNLTIQLGDDVMFDIENEHSSIEVSQATWNANGNTPLAGGWNLPLGGGMVLVSQLEVGMHWYVCGPHASGGMKGTIMVESTTSINKPPASLALTLFPNPTNGYVQMTMSSEDYKPQYDLEIYNILGDKVYAAKSLEQDAIIELNLSGLSAGTYILKLYDGVYVSSRKLIIQ